MRVTTQMEQKVRDVAHKVIGEALEGHPADVSVGPKPPAYGNVQRVDGGYFAEIPIFVSDQVMEEK